MAKKKASAKKASVKKSAPKKTAVKKSVKKAAPKSKPTKKTAAAKVAKKPAKAVAKKAVKKTAKKSVVKAAAKKPAAKKTAPKKAVVKKAAAKKATKPAVKAPAKTAAPAKAVTSHLVREAKATKTVDLSDFVTPLDDRLIVQVSAAERMTAGGLYIPDTVSDSSGNLQGVVVSVGRGHISKKGHLTPMDVTLGDKVVFAQYAGTKINLQNEDLVILRESEVMGIVGK